MVWAVGLGAWDAHTGDSLTPTFRLSYMNNKEWMKEGVRAQHQTDRHNKPVKSGLCRSLSCGAGGEKLSLQIGAHHSPHQTYVTTLTPSPTQQVTHSTGISSIFKPQFHQTGYSKGPRDPDPCGKCIFWFHSDVVQCKRVKKTCYLHIYICVYRKRLYKWGRWPAYTSGTPHPGDTMGQTSHIPLTLQGVKSQPVTLKMRTEGGWKSSSGKELLLCLQPQLPAQTYCMDVEQRGGKEGGESS